MKNSISLKSRDITISNFSNLNQSIIEINIINQIKSLNLIQPDDKNIINIKDQNVKRIIKYQTIYQLCEYYKNLKTNHRKIIYIQPEIINNNSEMFNYCNYDLYKEVILTTLNKINIHLPIFIYFSKLYIDFECYPNCDKTVNIGIIEDMFMDMTSKFDQKRNGNQKSFKMIKKYCEKSGLKFLSEQYFNDLGGKMIML